jgi:hypothetical protein
VSLSRSCAVAIASLISCTLLLPSSAHCRGGGGHGGGNSSSHSSSSHSSSSHSSSKSSSSGSSVHVQGHTTKNGTYVPPHERSRPDGNFSNNWSTKGNVNPFTGKEGTRVTPPGGQSGFVGSTSRTSSGLSTPSAQGAPPSASVSSAKTDGDSVSARRALPRASAEEGAIAPIQPATAVRGATESPQTVITPRHSNLEPNGAAPARFASKLVNARALIKAGVLQPARKYLTDIIDGAPGTSIAAEAQRELEALPR